MIQKKFVDYITAENKKFTGICLINDDHDTVSILKRKIWMFNGAWHRLDGPGSIDTYISADGAEIIEYKFWINDKQIKEEDYWNNPLVIKAKINKILKL